ncbi:diguanylate cyclase [Myxococcota bacterium]
MTPDAILPFIFNRLNSGIIVLNRSFEIQYLNRFMLFNSGLEATAVLNRSVFDCFPGLPKAWLQRRCNVVFLLNQYAFSSWQQRPYLFEFRNRQPLTADVSTMRQDCTFLPVKDEHGHVGAVCILVTDVTETSAYCGRLNAALAELEELSIRDGLTQVLNRRQIEHLLGLEFSRHKRYDSPLSVAMLDVDHFKSFNDTHGHIVGDEVLRAIAASLSKRIRSTDHIGRFGGEEFLILLPGTYGNQAELAAEAFRSLVERLSIECQGKHLRATVSLGTCAADAHHAAPWELVRDADSALYRAKAGGRNRVVRWIVNEEPRAPEGP